MAAAAPVRDAYPFIRFGAGDSRLKCRQAMGWGGTRLFLSAGIAVRLAYGLSLRGFSLETSGGGLLSIPRDDYALKINLSSIHLQPPIYRRLLRLPLKFQGAVSKSAARFLLKAILILFS
jgi:hypothetical protein